MVATLMLALEVLFLKLKPLLLTGIAGGLITLKLQENAAPCPRAQDCKTLPMWQEYYEQTRAFFDSKTLSDFII